jgi:hypothetical protein
MTVPTPDDPAPPNDPTPPGLPAGAGGKQDPEPEPKGTIDDLPKWAQDQLRQARGDAARYRTKANELEPLAQKARELEQASQSELERATNDRDGHKSRADTAESQLRKFQVAMDKAPEHATLAHVRAVAKRLAGESDEDLESDADELFGLLAPKPAETEEPPKVPSRPTERMPRGGGDPEEPPVEMDPRKLAELVTRAK